MADASRETVGRTVRDRRRDLGLSQSGLARAAGVSVGMVRDLEQGRTARPHPSSVNQLSCTLGIEIPLPPARPGPDPAGPPPPAAAADPGGGLRLLILGTFEVWRDHRAVRLRPGKQRDLVAYLALNVGAAVHQDTLIDVLWQDTPPARADRLLGEYVRTARGALSAGPRQSARGKAPAPGEQEVIERVGRGFRLNKALIRRDAEEFLELSDHGRVALSASRYDQAADLMGRALRLWRGEALQDIDTVRYLPELTALQRVRVRTTLNLADAHSARGLHGEALALLESLAGGDPLDETIQAKLLMTLARSGGQAQALLRYRDFSALLDRELGILPGPELAETQRRILNRELGYESSAAAQSLVATLTVPRQLLPDSTLFTGRDKELADLVAHVESAGAGADAPNTPVVAVDGMAGVGKTALAIRLAHQVKGGYPDGQLFADLHGHSPNLPPRSALAVLTELLCALGTPLELIPEDLEARSALYRSQLAGTKTLIVLDNVSTAGQVRHLLPGSSGCLVIVTSRRRLVSLDEAHQVTIGVLSDDDGYRLLARTAGAGASDSDEQVLRELAALCGELPLALRIIGASLRRSPQDIADTMAERLRGRLSGQDPLSAFDDGERNLRSVFDLSYQALHRRHRDLFRMLGLMPGQDIDAYGAAALAGIGVQTARNLLGDLADDNLLAESEPGRFHFHDLLRLDAWTRAQAQDAHCARAAGERLLAYFEATARRADRFIRREAAPAPQSAAAGEGPRIESRGQAVDWMRAEITNLLAAVRQAVGFGDHRRVIALSDSLYGFMQSRGPWTEAVELQSVAVRAARHGRDPRAVASPLARLGLMHRLTGNIPAAVAELEAAYEACGPRADGAQAACILSELGEAYRQSGDYRRSQETLRAALAIHVAAGDPAGRAQVLVRLSLLALISSSDLLDSVPALDEALEIYQETGDGVGLSKALSQRGDIYRICGDYQAADTTLLAALDRCRGGDDPATLAAVLLRFGYLRHLMGDLDSAWRAVDEAFGIYVRFGSIAGRANALNHIGALQAASGDHRRAAETFTQAKELYVACGSKRGRDLSEVSAAESRYRIGDRAAAAAVIDAAAQDFRADGDTVNEAHTLTLQGSFALDADDAEAAVAAFSRALTLSRTNRRVLTELAALRGLATAYTAWGREAEGVGHLEAAAKLARERDLPEAASIEARPAAPRRGWPRSGRAVALTVPSPGS